MADTIFIEDLRLHTRIGVYEWEQHVPQPIALDLEIAAPSRSPFSSDDFCEALDYAAVVERLRALAATHPHRLLERFAEAVADIVVGEFGAPWVRVRVAKLGALPGVRRLGVQIERSRQP